MTEIEGIDYFTGAEVPVSKLNLITAEQDTPHTKEFAEFAALFCKKYGVACKGFPPLLLTDSSLETVKHYYDSGMKVEV